jgi:hypothetical protein
VRERLGGAVSDVLFDRGLLRAPFLSVQYARAFFESAVGPVTKVVTTLQGDAARLSAFRRELDGLLAQYFEPTENVLRQDYLLTRARKLG